MKPRILSAARLSFPLASAIAALLAAPSAQAASGTWTGTTAGPFNWSDTTQWSGGTVASGAGFTANFNNTTGTNVTTTLDTAITLANILRGGTAAGTISWTITGSNLLTLDNGAGSASISNNQNAAQTLTVDTDILLNSNLFLNGNGNNNAAITLGSSVGGHTITGTKNITINSSSGFGNGNITFNSNIDTSGSITNSTTGTSNPGTVTINGTIGTNVTGVTENSVSGAGLVLTGANTYTGATTVGTAGSTAKGGTLKVSGTAGTINASSGYTINGVGSVLLLDNTAGNVDRLKDSTSVVTLNYGGELSLTGNATTNSSETTASLALGSGSGIMTVTSATSRVTTLAVAGGLTRTNFSTGLVRGTALDQSATATVSKITLGTAPTGADFVGSNTISSGATNDATQALKIVPWLLGDTAVAGTGKNFVTYDSTLGLRVLNATEMTTLAAGSTTAASPVNALAFNGTVSTSGLTVNSLLFNTATQTLNGSGALTVNSGAVAAVTNTEVIGSGFSSLALGNGQGVITATSGNTLTINTPVNVTSSGGLTTAGAGTIVLGASALYTGQTTVNQGTLQIGTGTAGSLGSNTSNIVLNGGSLSFGRTNAGLTLSNTISGIGGVTQNGTGGTTILSGPNTYSGGTTITAGILKIGNATALGDNAGAASVASGAALDLNGTTMTGTNALTISGTGVSSGGALTNSSGTAGTYAGLIKLGATGTSIVSNSGNIIISNTGTITGATFGLTLDGTATGSSIASAIGTTTGTLTKQGTGTWTLSNTNTYTGNTTVSGGVLKLGIAASLPGGIGSTGGTSMLILDGGVVGLGAGTFSRGVGSTTADFQFTANGGGFAAYGGNRSVSPGTLNWGSTVGTNIVGTLMLSAADSDSTITWTSNISQAGATRTIQVADGSSAVDAVISGQFLSNSGGLTKTGTGTLALTNSNLYTGATLVSAGTLMLGNGTGNVGNIGTTTSIAVSSNATLAANRTGATTQATDLGGVIVSGAGSFAQVGSGTTTLSLANTYSGGTTITNGTLVAGVSDTSTTAGAFGGSSRAVSLGDTTGTNSASLLISGAFTVGNDVTVQTGSTSNTLTMGGSNATGTAIFSGAINLGTSGANPSKDLKLVAAAGGTVNFSGVFNENTSNTTVANITVGDGTNTGTVILSNTANLYSGTTTINGGTLQVGALAAASSNSSIGNSSGSSGNLVINGGTLKYAGTAATTTNRLFQIGTGGATLDASGTTLGTLSFTNSGSITFTSSAAPASLTLTGTGTGTAGAGSLLSVIADSGTGANTTSLTKSGNGTWTLSGANTYSGGTTLSAGTLVLSGGTNRLLNTGSVAFAGTSTLDIGSTSQTLAAITVPDLASLTSTIKGSGGTLTLNGASDLQWGPGGQNVGATTYNTVVDLSGLSSFVFNASGNTFRVGYKNGTTNTAGAAGTSTVTLAGSNTITAANLNVADQNSSSNGGTGTLHLGAANTLNVGNINVGFAGRSNATLDFSAGSSAVTIRNTDGTSAVTSWGIGKVQHTASSTWTDTVDFSNGTVDALVTTMTIGSANTGTITGRAGTTNGSFTMAAGTLTVSTMSIGEYLSGTGGTLASSSTYAGNGTFTLNSATGTANVTTLTMGTNTGTATLNGSTASASGTFNLTNGTLKATTVQKGAQTGNGTATVAFNWANGTISNLTGTNLAWNNIPITLSTGTHTFDISGSNTATLNSGSAIGGGAFGVTKQGTGTLALNAANSYTGATAIKAGSMVLDSGTNRLAVAGSVVLGDTGTTGKLVLGGTTVADQTLTGLTTTGLGGSVVGGNASNSTLTLNIASGTNTFNGTLGGAGTNENKLALTKSGAGALSLSLANTYTGGTAINGGFISAQNAAALGTGLVTITGSSSGLYNLAITATYANDLQLNGGYLRTGGGSGASTYSGSVTVGSGGFQMGGDGGTSGVTISGNVNIGTSGNSLTTISSFAGTISGTISGAGTFTVSNTSASSGLLFSNSINNSGGTLGISYSTTTKQDLTLSGTNGYTGDTAVSSGRILVSSAANLSNGATAITQSGTGQLLLNANSVNLSNNFSISTTGYAEGDALSNIDGAIRLSNGDILSGTITLAGNSRIGTAASNTNTISGKITGGFGIDFYGMNLVNNTASVFIVSNTTNDYTGATTIYNNDNAAARTGSSTTLRLGNSNVIPSGASAGNVVFNGADANHLTILDLNGNSQTINGTTVTAAAGARITNSGSGASTLTIGANDTTSTFSGTITDSGTGKTLAISKTGTGTLTFSGANSYTGLTTVSNGILQVNTDQALGTNASGTTVSSGAALKLNGVAYATTEALTINGTGVSGGGALVNSGTSSYAGPITAASNATINSGGGSLTLSGGLDKTGTVLTLTGGGTINISGAITGNTGSPNSDLVVDATTVNLNTANTYNGPTYIKNGGTLNATVANALPTANGASAIHIDETGTGGSTLSISNTDQTIASLSGGTAGSSTVVALDNQHLTVGDTTTTTYAGTFTSSGSGELIKQGGGTLILTGNSGGNSGNYNVRVTDGTLSIDQTGALGKTNATKTLFMTNGGTLQTTATMTFNTRIFDLGTGGGQFDVGSGTTLTTAGTIQGAGDLTKKGDGTMVLPSTGTVTGFTGNTNVNAGTLVVNANISTSITTVNSGATLAGNGTVGVATVDGVISPGDTLTTIDTLHAAGNVTWNYNQAWVFELGSAVSTLALADTTGTRDLFDITGNFLKGTGSSFTFDFGGTGATGYYKLVDWTGSTGFSGSDFVASNLPIGLSGNFTVDPATSALYLNVVPEPDVATLIGGLGMLCLLRRRR